MSNPTPPQPSIPPLGWTTEAITAGVIDGDTLDVEVRRTVRVRLADCWAPETRTNDFAEKRAGLAARQHLSQLAPLGATCVLHVPGHTELQDAFTFGRVVGRVWVDGVELSAAQVAAGHATARKRSQ